MAVAEIKAIIFVRESAHRKLRFVHALSPAALRSSGSDHRRFSRSFRFHFELGQKLCLLVAQIKIHFGFESMRIVEVDCNGSPVGQHGARFFVPHLHYPANLVRSSALPTDVHTISSRKTHETL